MPSDYCERCDLPLAMCQHGTLLGRVIAQGSPEFWQGLWEMAAEDEERGSGLGPWVEARYSGRCRACGERWEPGDMIRASDDDGGWLCEGCGAG